MVEKLPYYRSRYELSSNTFVNIVYDTYSNTLNYMVIAQQNRPHVLLTSGESARLKDIINRFNVEEDKEDGAKSFVDSLSKRERQVMDLVSLGASNTKVSEVLNIKIRTVERHMSSIYLKANLSGEFNNRVATTILYKTGVANA